MESVRNPVRHMPTSLMSGATAHTVKPSLAASSTFSGRAKRKLPIKIVLLALSSAALGLGGAASVSHFRARPAPVMQIVSGNPALKKGSDGASVRWHSAKNKIYFDASLDSAGTHAREAVQLGFGTWVGSGAKLPGMDFDSTTGAQFGQVPNGKSEVMYGPISLAGHENDLALTVTFSDPKTGEVVESDMIFNSRHPYGVLSYKQTDPSKSSGDASDNASCELRYDLQNVATHEAGHFFGLGEDFEAKTATMYYTTGRCETNKRVLSNSDETTMDALYVANDPLAADDASASTAKGCGGARIGQGKTSGSVPLLSVLGLLGFVAWRRRQRV
jgi:MYXO-CTERM domain-containing protein